MSKFLELYKNEVESRLTRPAFHGVNAASRARQLFRKVEKLFSKEEDSTLDLQVMSGDDLVAILLDLTQYPHIRLTSAALQLMIQEFRY